MKISPPDLLLHPLRLKIVEALADADPMTPQEMIKRFPDVAPATLYRHLKLLAENGVVSVAAERKVRGVVERSYTLGATGLPPQEVLNASRKDQFRHFARFASVLLEQYAEYLGQEKIDLLTDGVGYRQAAVYATDEEFQAFTAKLVAALREATQQPKEGRKRRWVSMVVMPAGDPFDGVA